MVGDADRWFGGRPLTMSSLGQTHWRHHHMENGWILRIYPVFAFNLLMMGLILSVYLVGTKWFVSAFLFVAVFHLFVFIDGLSCFFLLY